MKHSTLRYTVTASGRTIVTVGAETYGSDDPQCEYILIRPDGITFLRNAPWGCLVAGDMVLRLDRTLQGKIISVLGG